MLWEKDAEALQATRLDTRSRSVVNLVAPTAAAGDQAWQKLTPEFHFEMSRATVRTVVHIHAAVAEAGRDDIGQRAGGALLAKRVHGEHVAPQRW
jgi:hypothetical protein